MHLVGNAGGLAAEQENVVRLKAVIEIGQCRLGREQYEATVSAAPPSLEFAPRRMPHDVDGIEIVHPGAAEGPVGGRKAGRFDNVRRNPKAGAQAQNGSGILRNIGLIEGNAKGHGRTSRADSRSADRACIEPASGVPPGAMAALWVSSRLPLHSPGKGANKPPPECNASDLPQAGCEPICRCTRQNRSPSAAWGGINARRARVEEQ